MIENIGESYPIAIFITPYATQRDILDYVKKQYTTHIKPVQDKYTEKGVEIGKKRGENYHTSERDSFICKNNHLPSSKIASMVREKYGDMLEYSHINKIIKRKCPRRNRGK